MTQNTTANQHINDFLDYYMNLSESQYAVLLSGKWGSGKTHFIEKFKNDHTDIHIVKISLFGLKFKEDIHKKIVLEQFAFPKTSEAIAKNMHNVLEKFTGINLNLTLSDISVGSAIKQMGSKTTLFVFDDLERMEMSFPEAFGYINQLVEEYGQKVIFIADDTKLKDRVDYLQFKEKIIGKTFEIEQDFETAFKTFTAKLENSKDILDNNQSGIKTVFDQSKYQNLRSLRQGILDFDRLIEQFEEKFKKHSELMTEFIQMFFALAFEMKSGTFDIQKDLQTRHAVSMHRTTIARKSEKEKIPMDIFFNKYDFLNDLLLSKASWIKLFTTHNLGLEEVSKDLYQSKYFLHEQQAEWKKLWHFMYLEQEEFQNAFDSMLNKLQKNEYLEPTVILHITGILLELIDKSINGSTKDQIVHDIKKYIDLNLQKLKGIYTLNDYELDGHYTDYGYRSEESDEFKQIKDYLLKQTDNLRNEGLKEKGTLLIQYLSENNIQEFVSMLVINQNKEVLYRLPVFNAIEPKAFFDVLLKIENKNIRDVLEVLKNRYSLVFSNAQEDLVKELEFWKSFIEIINSYEVEIPCKIKDVWIKKSCHDVVENEIIQKIKKEIERKNRIEQLEVTENEQSNN